MHSNKWGLQVEGKTQHQWVLPVKGCDYWDTYAPVATWGSICLILATAIVQGWHSKQIDFVMAFTQAPVKCDMHVHGNSKGFCSHQQWRLCPQDPQEYLWAKASRQGLEQASCFQAQVHWVPSVQEMNVSSQEARASTCSTQMTASWQVQMTAR